MKLFEEKPVVFQDHPEFSPSGRDSVKTKQNLLQWAWDHERNLDFNI
jgi:hypothetical protein